VDRAGALADGVLLPRLAGAGGLRDLCHEAPGDLGGEAEGPLPDPGERLGPLEGGDGASQRLVGRRGLRLGNQVVGRHAGPVEGRAQPAQPVVAPRGRVGECQPVWAPPSIVATVSTTHATTRAMSDSAV
jgi:hypothetical protein